MDWGTLFERADAYEVTVAEIREQRGASGARASEAASGNGVTDEQRDADRREESSDDRTDDR